MASINAETTFEACLRLAKELLKKNSEFYPFAITQLKNGSISLVSTYFGKDNPTSNEVLTELTTLLKARKKAEFLAVAVCKNVTITREINLKKEDALEIDIETYRGESISIFIPYRRGKEKYLFDEPFSERKDQEFFN